MSRNKFGNRISHREENNMRIFLLKEKRYINIKNTFLKKHNVFAEEIDTIAWASHDDKKLQSIDFDRNICIQNEQRSNIKKEEIKCCNIIKLYKILLFGGSGSVKTNVLLNLISQQPDIDKIYL